MRSIINEKNLKNKKILLRLDLNVPLEKNKITDTTRIDKINSAFQNYSKKNKILEITKEKLVSIDFNHNPASSIVDATLTNVIGRNMGKISAWYDNEWGFSNRMCDIVEYLHKNS